VKRAHRERVSPTAAGLIAIGLIALACYFAFGGSLPWSSSYEIRAVVRSANELHSRTPVRIAGVNVGNVTGFKRGPGGTAIITMALDDSARPIHSDATLKIRPRIFLEGNFFVDLKPGSPSAPEMPDGGTIPLANTATPVQLDQILSALDSPTRGNLLHFVHALATSVQGGGSPTFDKTLQYWAPTFTGVAVDAQALRGLRDDDLSSFIRDGGRTAAAIAADRLALANLVTGLNRSTRALAERRASFDAALGQLAATVDQAGPAFEAINAAIPGTRALVGALRPSLRVAPPSLRSANLLLDQVGALIRPPELPALLDQLDPAVVSLARLEPQLQQLLSLLSPVTECLRTDGLPTLSKSVDDGPLSTGMPVYRELLDSVVGLASASQNFDGNGTALRYHAGFGDEMVSLGDHSPEGQVVGLTSQPILGSRPAYTGVRPPFRPDVPCAQDAPPDLKATTGPPPEQRKLGDTEVSAATRKLAAAFTSATRKRLRASGSARP
jgi:phospholipid/cholesterol/gamma-HCH transport system substrate-binding protein